MKRRGDRDEKVHGPWQVSVTITGEVCSQGNFQRWEEPAQLIRNQGQRTAHSGVAELTQGHKLGEKCQRRLGEKKTGEQKSAKGTSSQFLGHMIGARKWAKGQCKRRLST